MSTLTLPEIQVAFMLTLADGMNCGNIEREGRDPGPKEPMTHDAIRAITRATTRDTKKSAKPRLRGYK